jgi:hypothetical protein
MSTEQNLPATSATADQPLGRYRKKPVIIDAFHYSQPGAATWARLHAWLDQWHEEGDGDGRDSMWENPDGSLTIPTLEGDHRCDVGDWIIRGVEGEFYPCKPGIFTATYEPSEPPATATGGSRATTTCATGTTPREPR